MTRIAIDLRMYRHSGIGRYLRNLLPPLLPLLHAESIRIVAPSALVAGAAWLNDSRVEVVAVDAPVYSLAEQLLPLRRVFAQCQLLWVPHFNVPMLYSGRLVVTIHDIAPLAMPEILSNAIKRAYARLLIQQAVAHASEILCVSQFSADELERRLSVPPARITVTPLAPGESWPRHAAPHGESDGTPYLLFVGNVKPNKNLKLLLDAFARVSGTLPHRVVIAGRKEGLGTGDEAVLRQAASFGPRVRFTDEVSDQELIALYAGASALVLPSLYEGFGLPILEAMRLGCPVISSNAASLPEVAGSAALFFDPRSPSELAARLLQISDQPLMDSLRAAGRNRAAEFSYPRCAVQTAAVLNRQMEKS